MAVIPGTVGQYPTTQTLLVPFLAGGGEKLLGVVAATALLACTVSAVGLLSLPVGATGSLGSPVAATAAISVGPGATVAAEETVDATIRLNAQEVRNV